jgi:hypothetical protein
MVTKTLPASFPKSKKHMARKPLLNSLLAIYFGCENIKNFSDDVVFLMYLNPCFLRAIQTATLFCESTSLFFMNNC